ncbi:DUF4864 domain-containing protein [Roseibium denhamense]|uniref:DUF4864 domain-containing protein n=1 Tax=Roseibium denhamense TaxID=76305 RepID=A0ABY1NPH9_9HYPH|nr:DUF4864 domain-containing protein [Roseibium denhamense]MTI07911.1 DUF4864 domain-containing protein [Roseibium denhamense]SMP14915.1 protein of unknown function [Roseibium denhamense]
MLKSLLKPLGAGLLFGLITLSPAAAEADFDSSVFQSIIKNQMNAFAADDARTAFSFATSGLQQRFQTPEFFMEMVRNGYQPVYRPKDVTFGQSKMTSFGPTQEVYVTGPKGQNWLALYSFEQQEDGTWRISGCYLTKSEGFAA